MVFIYVLSLENNKYYIGKTNIPYKRIISHFSDDGSAWTQKHKPVDIHRIIPDCDDFDETKHTLEYMKKYGINNVRGGIYCGIYLSHNEMAHITKQLNCAMDKCFKCGGYSHFAKEFILLNNDNKRPNNETPNDNQHNNKRPNNENLNDNQHNNKRPNNNQHNNCIIEYAKSDRSKCRICDIIINQNELRIGCKTDSKFGEILLWHHIICYMNKKYAIDLNENIEFAITNKSKCQTCDTIINQNELQIGCKSDSELFLKEKENILWRHVKCVCASDKITFNI